MQLRKRTERNQEGFTLIELMVVVMIIAILIAIAVPTFLGARERAQNRAAQSNVRTALSSAKVIFSDNQSYADATVAALNTAEPSLTFQAGASSTPKQVSILMTATKAVLTVRSQTGKCYTVRDNTVSGGTEYGQTAATSGNCPATETLATTTPAQVWSSTGF